jgi:excisionase family DNA binding protein
VTVREAAKRLEASESLVYSLVAAGKLRYCRIGHGRGRIRIPEDAVVEYLARCMVAVREEKPRAPLPGLKHIRLS